MSPKLILASGLFAFVVNGVCLRAVTAQSNPNPQALADRYFEAVEDAAIPELGENVSTLIDITPNNPRLIWNDDHSKVLVVTWKSQAAYDRFLAPNTHTAASERFVTWVTLAPEVKEFCQQYLKDHPDATSEEINLRLKQYLGLHYDWQYDVFVEMWVDPAELFRPCVDPEVTDRQCNLNFGDGTPSVKNIASYPGFYTNLYFTSFRGLPGVPWTGLGYTYDWGNPVSDVGASEFILVPNAAYSIHQVQPTTTYCQASIVDS